MQPARKTIYIAGPIKGVKGYKRAFQEAERELTQQGWDVCSPINISGELREIIALELDWICRCADAMYMLRGWESSEGANIEHALAVYLNLTIIYQEG